MSQEPEEKLWKELDGGTLFMAVNFWQTDTKVMRFASGIWPWEEISSVEHISEDIMPDVQPRCALKWQGAYLYLQVDFDIVATAWRKWRLRYGRTHLTFTTDN